MSRPIPEKKLREIRAVLLDMVDANHRNRLVGIIDWALTPKRRESKVSWPKPTKAQKKAAHKAETTSIVGRVRARSGGRCEMCLCRAATEFHHVFGRVQVKQSHRNVLHLCTRCHRLLTDNKPNAVACWADVRDIFSRLGFGVEAEMAEDERVWHVRKEGKAA